MKKYVFRFHSISKYEIDEVEIIEENIKLDEYKFLVFDRVKNTKNGKITLELEQNIFDNPKDALAFGKRHYGVINF